MASLSEADAAIQACEYLEAYKSISRTEAEISWIRNHQGYWKVTFETPTGEIEVLLDENTGELAKDRCDNLRP